MFLYGDVAGIATYMIIEKRIHLYYCLKVMKATNLLLCLLMTVAVIVIFTPFCFVFRYPADMYSLTGQPKEISKQTMMKVRAWIPVVCSGVIVDFYF